MHWDKGWAANIQELMPRPSGNKTRRLSTHSAAKAALQDIKASLQNATDEDIDVLLEFEESVFEPFSRINRCIYLFLFGGGGVYLGWFVCQVLETMGYAGIGPASQTHY